MDFVLSGRQRFGIFVLSGRCYVIGCLVYFGLSGRRFCYWLVWDVSNFVLSGRCVVMSLAVLVFVGLSRGRHRVLGSVLVFPFLSFGCCLESQSLV